RCRAVSTRPAPRTALPRRRLRRAGEHLRRSVHQLDGVDAGIEDVLQRRLGALVLHRPIAVSNDTDLHAIELRVRLRLEGRPNPWNGDQGRCRNAREGQLPELTSRKTHIASILGAEYAFARCRQQISPSFKDSQTAT